MNRIVRPSEPEFSPTPRMAISSRDDVAPAEGRRPEPHHRSIIGVDIEDATARTNVVRGALRGLMYSMVEQAMALAGISDRYQDDWVDTGDGVLVFVHPADHLPKTLLANTFIPTLGMLLTRHNSQHPDLSFRLRAVVHAGEIHFDERGAFGEAMDLSFRLLNAAQLKKRLKQVAAANLILVVSDYFYQSVIRHGYDGINERDFERAIQVRLGNHRHRGWVHVPDVTLLPPAAIIRPVIDLDSRRGPCGS